MIRRGGFRDQGSGIGFLVGGFALGVAGSAPLPAQVVRGVVRDIESKTPISGAAVYVRDSANKVIGFERTDASGTFTLRLPPGGFAVRAARVGFTPESASTAGLAGFDTTNVLLEMRALAIRLTPAVVTAERNRIRDVKVLGLSLRTMSTSIITPSEIALGSRGARDYLDALRVALPAGVMVNERSRCITMARAAGFQGRTCARVFVDGVLIEDELNIITVAQPQWLDHAIFVRPTDAGVRFGTGAAGGVLLLFTKFGGYAIDPDVPALADLKKP
jgi:hypothetical protein